jgi:hypothetical protein
LASSKLKGALLKGTDGLQNHVSADTDQLGFRQGGVKIDLARGQQSLTDTVVRGDERLSRMLGIIGRGDGISRVTEKAMSV